MLITRNQYTKAFSIHKLSTNNYVCTNYSNLMKSKVRLYPDIFSDSFLMPPNFLKSYIIRFHSMHSLTVSHLYCRIQTNFLKGVNNCTVKAYPSHTIPTDDGTLPWKVLRLLNVHLTFILLHQPGPFCYSFFSDLITCLP